MSVDKAIQKFGKIRDAFDRTVKILELFRAADYLYEKDKDFLDKKLDDLKVRAEEIRIEDLRKPKYTPPPTKLSSDIADNISMACYLRSMDVLGSKAKKMEEFQGAIDSMYSSSPWLNAAIIGASGITPGDTMYGIDYSGEPIEFTVTSHRNGLFYVKDNETGVSYMITSNNVEKYLTPFLEDKCLARLKPTLRFYKYEY